MPAVSISWGFCEVKTPGPKAQKWQEAIFEQRKG
jgi:hypothetical protein